MGPLPFVAAAEAILCCEEIVGRPTDWLLGALYCTALVWTQLQAFSPGTGGIHDRCDTARGHSSGLVPVPFLPHTVGFFVLDVAGFGEGDVEVYDAYRLVQLRRLCVCAGR